ncbi:MAG: TetR/AcrR family transcriptional regulator [Desulfomonilaceae bacterium]
MSSSITPEISAGSQSCEKRLSRRERRCAETRERLIEHALRLFSERGFAETTVEDITNAADVGKGTFFNYFPSKEHILIHLRQLKRGKFRGMLLRALHSAEPMHRVILKLVLTLNKEFADSPALVRSILVPLFSSESMREQMADDLEADRLVLAELMAARQQQGEIRDDLPPIELALQFQQALIGTTVLWALNPSRPLPDCLKEMTNVLWSGIRAPQTDGQKSG